MIGQGKLSVFLPQKIKITSTSNMSAHEKQKNHLMGPHNAQFQKSIGNSNSVLKPTSDLKVPIFLPKILLTNLRSFGKYGETDKTTDLKAVLDLNTIDIGVFTETWATDNTVDSLDNTFDNYIMFHLIRSNCKRASGGVSIFVKDTIPATRLDVNVPNHLEIIYVSVTPKRLPRSVSTIIFCGVYFPGTTSEYAPSQEDILLHLTETIQSFYTKYDSPLIMLLGDFNDLDITDLCEICLLKQVVNVHTRDTAILDLIMTNIDNQLYREPVSLPSIGNSDHLCVLYVPEEYIAPKDTKEKIMVRKFYKSAMIEFGSWISRFDWSLLFEIKNVNDKVAYFSAVTWLMVDKYFPLKKVLISSTDKEWMTPKIKLLILQRQKALKLKKADLHSHLARKVTFEIRKAKLDYNKSKSP